MPPSRIIVTFLESSGKAEDQRFDSAFRIGRTQECGVCIKNEFVSRVHAEVTLVGNEWWIRDLGSSNGVFIDECQVESYALTSPTIVRFGVAGPEICLMLEEPPPQPAAKVDEKSQLAHYISHYFDASNDEAAPGEHTVFVRKAFATVQAKEKRKYGTVAAIMGVCIVAASLYAFYEHREIAKQKSSAEALFYAMKALDVDIANLERLAFHSSDETAKTEVRRFQARRVDTQKSYDDYLAALHVYDPKMTARRRLVLRVTRIFGECELTMPAEFADEIDRYIKNWQSTDRLKKAVALAAKNNYTKLISNELLAQDLPPQFFYLALQESNFDPYVSGPMTSKGIAKGMWQFIPETALKYGLHIGPLVDLRRPDVADDRHHYDRATKAAASYLKDLYSTDAQASGLLVMASYNWGEGRVLPLIRSMPDNPKERNFWRLLTQYKDKVPKETYDYVFSIVSAAVIGEDPALFGFDFENPLASLNGN